MKDVTELMNSFKEIVSQATIGETNAKRVAKELREQSINLRKMADTLCLLARNLDGGTSMPIAKEPVIIKSEQDEEEYKESKQEKKPRKKRVWSQEQRDAARIRMQQRNKERWDAYKLRQKLMSAVEKD